MPSPVKLGVLGLLLVAGVTPSASAGHFFRKCQPDCEKDVVRLPAREIVVETSRPQVTVSESRHEKVKHGRTVMPAAPVVATIFTPSFVPVSAPVVLERDVCPPDRGRNLLQAAHELELHVLEMEKLRAIHRAEQAAMSQISARVSASMKAQLTSDLPVGPAGVKSVDDEIRAELSKLNERMTRLEELVLAHDNLLRKQHEDARKAGPKLPAAPVPDNGR